MCTEQKRKPYTYILAQKALLLFFINKMKSHMKISFLGFNLLETICTAQ